MTTHHHNTDPTHRTRWMQQTQRTRESARQGLARPVFLDLRKIELPITALASIAHRVSGILLVAALPFIVWMLEMSLRNAASYARLIAAFKQPLFEIVLLLLIWSLVYHAAAGVRHMLFDIGIGVSLRAARRTAWAVHGFAIAATLAVLLAVGV